MAEQLTLFDAFERERSKVCFKCLEDKPLSAFHKCKTARDGLTGACRPCRYAQIAEWKKRNMERVLECKKKRYHETEFGDRQRACARAWGMANKAERDARYKRWYAANREAKIEYNRRCRLENVELYNERLRARYAANPFPFTVHNLNRKARLKAAEGSHTADDLCRRHEIQGGLCWWCSEPVHAKGTVDHVIPLTRGGSNGPENLVIACRSCNSRKRTRLAYSEWTPPNPLKPDQA